MESVFQHKFNFIVGSFAVGDSFIGRHDYIKDISSVFHSGDSVHLVGATRIGKSSLVRRVFKNHASDSNIIPLEICLSNYNNAFDFWYTLSESILDCIHLISPSIWTPLLDLCQKKFSKISLDSPPVNWYIRISNLLCCALEELGNKSWRIVLSIDEFDAVTRVFAGEPSYYQLLRSLFSDDKYALCGIIISRRNLNVLEAKVPDISTFHGVFRRVSLTAFTDEDMAEFYNALRQNNVELDPQAKEQLFHFTGNIPYLCCMFAQYMSIELAGHTLTGPDITAIVKKKSFDIDQYYKDLVERLEDDNDLEPLIYLAFDDIRTSEYYRKRENMISMGLISQIEINNHIHFYAYSDDFMTYLRFLPKSIPINDLMRESEKHIKRMVSKEFPILNTPLFDSPTTYTCENAKNALMPYSAEFSINFTLMQKNGENLARYKVSPTILDVLNLKFVIDIIRGNLWQDHFGVYFNYDDGWKQKLKLIEDTRNPLAHASEDYISDDILCKCKHYCEELLKLEI